MNVWFDMSFLGGVSVFFEIQSGRYEIACDAGGAIVLLEMNTSQQLLEAREWWPRMRISALAVSRGLVCRLSEPVVPAGRVGSAIQLF